MFAFRFLSPDVCDCHVPIRMGLTSLLVCPNVPTFGEEKVHTFECVVEE